MRFRAQQSKEQRRKERERERESERKELSQQQREDNEVLLSYVYISDRDIL
jgi:hypothetical protein